MIISATPQSLRPLTDMQSWLTGFNQQISPSQPYSEPTSQEVATFLSGLSEFPLRATSTSISSLGFTISSGYEQESRLPYILAVNEYGTSRAWGAYLLDRSRPVTLLIQAPHPVADQYSESIALEMWQKIPGSLLMIAGAHRDAANELADVPWNSGSMFNKVAEALMPLPQLQVHGFANATAPDYDIVLAAGSATAGQLIRDIADAIELGDFRVGRVWEGVNVLTALGNKQSIIAQNSSTDFIHLEINRTVRDSSALTDQLVEIVSSMLI